MVSIKQQLEGKCPVLRQNSGTEQSKSHQLPLRGIRTHLYQFGMLAKDSGTCGALEEGQSLLDALLLSQWENLGWKGQLQYDVTTCAIKVITGGKKLIAQLNEQWNSKFLKEFENNAFQPSGSFKASFLKNLEEDILFCVASGEKETSELIPSTMLPNDGVLFIVNENPIEYGHVFLVPYNICQRPQFPDKRMLQLIAQTSAEINSCSFHISYDHNASTNSNCIYFQGGYFANPFPVELFPAIPIFGDAVAEGIHIYEVADYPLKALLFTSKNSKLMVEVVAEICSSLQQNHDIVFNLLVSDCGRQIFLFPQVCKLVSGGHLSTWECGGFFIYNSRAEFDCASEAELCMRMACNSLDHRAFQALKQFSCSIASKPFP